jgi:hypothetical protein
VALRLDRRAFIKVLMPWSKSMSRQLPPKVVTPGDANA